MERSQRCLWVRGALCLESLLECITALNIDLCATQVCCCPGLMMSPSLCNQTIQQTDNESCIVPPSAICEALRMPLCHSSSSLSIDLMRKDRRQFHYLTHADSWSGALVSVVPSNANECLHCAAASAATRDTTTHRSTKQNATMLCDSLLDAPGAFAAYLGIPTFVLPHTFQEMMMPCGRHKESAGHEEARRRDGETERGDFLSLLVGWIRRYLLSNPRCRVWVPFSATVDGWCAWDALRSALGRDTPVEMSDTGGKEHLRFRASECNAHRVQPLLMLPSHSSGAPVCLSWLGEDVGGFVVTPSILEDLVEAAHDVEEDSCGGAMCGSEQSVADCSWQWGALAHGASLLATCCSATGASHCDLLVTLLSGLIHRSNNGGSGRAGLVAMLDVSLNNDGHTSTLSTEYLSRVEHAFCSWQKAGDFLLRRHCSAPNTTSRRAVFSPFADRLQIPLQPLSLHLDSSTYHTFEEDRSKYAQYAAALDLYMCDVVKHHQQQRLGGGVVNKKEEEAPPLVVMVLGAGRGPLVTEVLIAATNRDVAVTVIAVDKNPSSVAFLRMKREVDPSWQELMATGGHNILVVHADGRDALPPSLSDDTRATRWSHVQCVVSELLGSTGDNELSPESIQGTLRNLYEAQDRDDHWNEEDAATSSSYSSSSGRSRSCRHPIVSIPMQYQCLVAPLQSGSLVECLIDASRRGVDIPPIAEECCSSSATAAAAGHDGHVAVFHTPFVAHVTNALLLADPVVAWTFEHKNNQLDGDGDKETTTTTSSVRGMQRRATLEFVMPHTVPCRVDMLVAYFDCVLYQSQHRDAHQEGEEEEVVVVRLSTVPQSWTPNMFSWFPCILPLRHALVMREGGNNTLVVDLARVVRKEEETEEEEVVGSVHYEWSVWQKGCSGGGGGGDAALNVGGWASRMSLA